MTMNAKLIVAVVAALFSLTGCSKDYLAEREDCALIVMSMNPSSAKPEDVRQKLAEVSSKLPSQPHLRENFERFRTEILKNVDAGESLSKYGPNEGKKFAELAGVQARGFAGWLRAPYCLSDQWHE